MPPKGSRGGRGGFGRGASFASDYDPILGKRNEGDALQGPKKGYEH